MFPGRETQSSVFRSLAVSSPFPCLFWSPTAAACCHKPSSHSYEPQPAQHQLHGVSGGSEDAGGIDGCLSHCSDVSFPLHPQHDHLKAVVCFDNSTQHLTSVGCALSPTPSLSMHLWGFAGCGDTPTLEQPNKYQSWCWQHFRRDVNPCSTTLTQVSKC